MDNDNRRFLFSFGAIIGVMGLILLGVVALVQLTTDPSDESLHYMSATASLMGWNGWILAALPLTLSAAIILFALHGFPDENGEGVHEAGPLLCDGPMSEAARSAALRISRLLSRFHAMPARIVPDDVSIEFEGIEVRHLPGLTKAHTEARAAVSPSSPESDAIDAEYAVSLETLGNSIERLVKRCEAVGRERLAEQARFIETRHTESLL